jgi:hypothetical protein
MLETFKNIPKSHKEKFLKMCLLLFSCYKTARFNNNGQIVFTPNRWYKRTVRIPIWDLLTFGVPRAISYFKWATLSLLDEMYEEIEKINLSTNDYSERITLIIDYLYPIFEKTKIRDIYNNYDTVITVKEELQNVDNHIETNNVYDRISLADRIRTLLNDSIHEIKLEAATITLTISLWLPTHNCILREVVPKVAEGVYSWKYYLA